MGNSRSKLDRPCPCVPFATLKVSGYHVNIWSSGSPEREPKKDHAAFELPSIPVSSLIEAEALVKGSSEEDVAMVAELFSGVDVDDAKLLQEGDIGDALKGKPLRVKVLARKVLRTAKGLSAEDVAGIRKMLSKFLGVSAYYLINVFKEELEQAMGQPVEDLDVTTYVPILCQMTKSKVCPQDCQMGSSFVDALPKHYKGKANFFVSWVWTYTVTDLTEGIKSFVEQSGLDPKQVFLWLCAFCNNQHRCKEIMEKVGRERITQELVGRMMAMRGVIVLLDKCVKPVYLERAWCVWEVVTAWDLGVPVQFVCRASALTELENVFKCGGIDCVKNAVAFKTATMHASNPADLAYILADIESKFGFEATDRKVLNGMVSFIMPFLKKWMSEGWDEQRRKREESEGLGISLKYLLGSFPQEARKATGLDDPTFPEISPILAYGPMALGFGKICPRDGKVGCSITDAMTADDKRAANKFLSWSWGYKLSDVIGALQDWAKNSHADSRKTFVWMCFCCLNQFRMIEEQKSGGTENLDEVFRRRLQSAGSLVALLDNWSRPRYFTRVWCVYEQFVAQELDIDVQVIFPPGIATSLRTTLRKDFHAVKAALTDVDVEQAEATEKSDETQVKTAIEASVGFSAVNRVVRSRFAEWCAQELARNVQGL